MSKLDDLCAIKVMGWYESIETVDDMTLHWWGNDTLVFNRRTYDWMPSVSLDDALVCLERAANGQRFEIVYVSDSMKLSGDRGWYAVINAGTASFETTAALAMCLCSLRAMGVPESEISLAMENDHAR